MSDLFTVQSLVALLTLTALEIVLGIDNVIFIAILSGKLPKEQQPKARQMGIGLAVISRILLLLGISVIIGLTTPLFAPFGNELSGRDIILLLGGLFLIGKSTYEIHEKLDVEDHSQHTVSTGVATLGAVLTQVILVDVVFSLDSVITAVGITEHTSIIIVAILVSAAIMVFFANSIADFIEKHPSLKILALSFLILIGSILVVEGWAHEQAEELHLKNYVYFAMAFSVVVDMLQLRLKAKEQAPVQLHNQPKLPESS
ncbi:MAG: TerC family protein [Ardenticatenaceae bacterium]|nr:TerC family protein [Ardenticatenaceae bacterium]